MKFTGLIMLMLSAQAFAGFQVGERVFDNRIYVAGYITEVLPGDAYNVKLDGRDKIKYYSAYYSEELGPQITPCAKKFCIGDRFKFTLPFLGKDRIGAVLEIFQDRLKPYIVYGVLLENESEVRYLNSDHLHWMVKL